MVMIIWLASVVLSSVSSQNGLAIEINSLIQDGVAETGPCKYMYMIFSCLDMHVLQLGIS